MPGAPLDADVCAYPLNTFVQEELAVRGGFARSPALFAAAALTAFAGQGILLRTYWMLEGVCRAHDGWLTNGLPGCKLRTPGRCVGSSRRCQP